MTCDQFEMNDFCKRNFRRAAEKIADRLDRFYNNKISRGDHLGPTCQLKTCILLGIVLCTYNVVK